MKQTPRQYAQALIEATDGLTPAQAEKIIPRFLILLRRSRSIKLLPRIVRSYERLQQAKTGESGILLETARPYSGEKLSALINEKNKNFKLTHEVNPKIQGGAVITIGDTRIDGSVAAALRRLRQTLTNSSSFVTHS